MKFIQRVGYYLGGFSIGLVILAFFLSGKKTSCSYGPEARVLKNINSKKIIYSDSIKREMLEMQMDSTDMRRVLIKGDINFSKSEPRQEPCALYYIEGYFEERLVYLSVENCDSIANIIGLTK